MILTKFDRLFILLIPKYLFPYFVNLSICQKNISYKAVVYFCFVGEKKLEGTIPVFVGHILILDEESIARFAQVIREADFVALLLGCGAVAHL